MKLKIGNKAIGLVDLPQLVLTFVLVGVIGAMGLYFNSQISTTANWKGTLSEAAVNNTTAAITTLMSWQGMIALVVIIGIVITVLVVSFAFGKQQGV